MPIHADMCRPFLNSLGSVTRALNALAITGPTEGTVSRRGPTSVARVFLAQRAVERGDLSAYRFDLADKDHQCCTCHNAPQQREHAARRHGLRRR
jgi:hypothetical protein